MGKLVVIINICFVVVFVSVIHNKNILELIGVYFTFWIMIIIDECCSGCAHTCASVHLLEVDIFIVFTCKFLNLAATQT